jgi:hypothetical protein
MPHPDDCPNPACDGRIEPSGSADEQEQGVCPKCGTVVRRTGGQPWMEATGPGADVS